MKSIMDTQVLLGMNILLTDRFKGNMWNGPISRIERMAAIEGETLAQVCLDPHVSLVFHAYFNCLSFVIRPNVVRSLETELFSRKCAANTDTISPSFDGYQCPKWLAFSAVLMAAALEEITILELLYSEYPMVFEQPDMLGMSPILWTCALGCDNSFQFMISKKIGVSCYNNWLHGCADLAYANKHPGTAQAALAAGAPAKGVIAGREMARLGIAGLAAVDFGIAQALANAPSDISNRIRIAEIDRQCGLPQRPKWHLTALCKKLEPAEEVMRLLSEFSLRSSMRTENIGNRIVYQVEWMMQLADEKRHISGTDVTYERVISGVLKILRGSTRAAGRPDSASPLAKPASPVVAQKQSPIPRAPVPINKDLAGPDPNPLDRAGPADLAAAGSDLSEPRDITHFFIFRGEAELQIAFAALQQVGLIAKNSGKLPDSKGFVLTAVQTCVPDPNTLDGLRRRLEVWAEELGGYYDGWETQCV